MKKVSDYFGCKVFDDRVMKARLSSKVYQSLRKTIDEGAKLDISVANAVAAAMKDWAVENGATHYTHWFQPLRGYTAWDPTSYAFIKGKSLCIPTAFCSYGGEALDKKTPLLRSMEALNRQAMRILHLFGNEDVKCVRTSVGPEQEYFLITEEMYEQRKDIRFTGRTLFGAKPPKGQEMDDHYFGVIKPRVAAYMNELNEELWKLGILAKTEHNEVAPAQHELAPIYTTTNIATDHNQLTMEIMQKVAAKHGLVCLLHEKPFAGVNGSGKHNNWSLATDKGVNLLSPGETPYENAQFLLFLCAVIKAPPAVVSIFLGDELNGVLEAIENDTPYAGTEKTQMKLGVNVLPKFNRDTTDRNRTSPFAFTGNKFEFRMLGSSNSIACANIMLNSAVAESLKIYADRLEKAEDFESALHEMIRKTIKDHKHIIFNGNGYDDTWIKEATEKRGLLNYRTTPDCMPHLLDEKNVRMLTSHKVFSEAELKSRCEIMLDNYCKTVLIEANTMIDMAKTEIAPAVSEYVLELAKTAAAKKAAESSISCNYETGLLKKLAILEDQIMIKAEELEDAVLKVQDITDITEESCMIRDSVLSKMGELRIACDSAETMTAKKFWPFPTYGDLLFSVR